MLKHTKFNTVRCDVDLKKSLHMAPEHPTEERLVTSQVSLHYNEFHGHANFWYLNGVANGPMSRTLKLSLQSMYTSRNLCQRSTC